jgi:hypothetical protein
MKKKFIATVLAALFVAQVFSEEKRYETLLGYKNVVVKKVWKDGIRIMHSGGFVNVDIEDISENVREDLGMSMEGLKDYREKKSVALAARSKQLIERSQKQAAISKRKKVLDETKQEISDAKVLSVTKEGCLIDMREWSVTVEVPEILNTTKRTGTALTGYRTFKSSRVVGTQKKAKSFFAEEGKTNIVFVKCNTDGLFDGSKIIFGLLNGDDRLVSPFKSIWPTGTHSYKTVAGSTNLVREFTNDSSDQNIATFQKGGALIVQRIEERAKKIRISAKKKKLREKNALRVFSLEILSITKDGFLAILNKGGSLQNFERTIFIRCQTDGLIHGPLNFAGYMQIWPIGTYSYTSVSGAAKTVQTCTFHPTDKDIIERN